MNIQKQSSNSSYCSERCSECSQAGRVSGPLDRECPRCWLGDCAENKAKRKKIWCVDISRTTGYWRTRYVKDLLLYWFWLMRSPAPSLVTYIWQKGY